MELKAIAVKTSITKSLSLHGAKYTFAYQMDRARLPLSTIQHLLGHGRLETTVRHIEELRETDELDDAMDGVF